MTTAKHGRSCGAEDDTVHGRVIKIAEAICVGHLQEAQQFLAEQRTVRAALAAKENSKIFIIAAHQPRLDQSLRHQLIQIAKDFRNCI